MTKSYFIFVIAATFGGLLLKIGFPIVTNQLDGGLFEQQLTASAESVNFQSILLPEKNSFMLQGGDCSVIGKVSLYIDDDSGLSWSTTSIRGYVFRGNFYENRPLISPIIYSAVGRFQSIFEDSTQFYPVYSVVTEGNCGSISWTVLPIKLHMTSFGS